VRILRGLAVALTLALAALVALIVPSRDNGPAMPALVVILTALVTVLVLLGYAGGLRAAPDPPAAPTDPPAERPG
jgi:hypothetical protein